MLQERRTASQALSSSKLSYYEASLRDEGENRHEDESKDRADGRTITAELQENVIDIEVDGKRDHYVRRGCRYGNACFYSNAQHLRNLDCQASWAKYLRDIEASRVLSTTAGCCEGRSSWSRSTRRYAASRTSGRDCSRPRSWCPSLGSGPKPPVKGGTSSVALPAGNERDASSEPYSPSGSDVLAGTLPRRR
ncbi:hypothetical protein MTO96_037538 [Rhipicephalus appendiculatus]